MTEAEYKAVYESEATASKARELVATKQALADLEIKKAEVGAVALRKELERSEAAYALFVGHNESGKFKFLDGTSMSLADIAEHATVTQKIPIFISCGAKSYVSKAVGVHRELGVSEALAATKEVMAFIQRHETVSPEQIQEHLTKFNQKYRVAYIVQKGCHAATGLLVVAIIIYLLDDDD